MGALKAIVRAILPFKYLNFTNIAAMMRYGTKQDSAATSWGGVVETFICIHSSRGHLIVMVERYVNLRERVVEDIILRECVNG
jgi:hypothetical protein